MNISEIPGFLWSSTITINSDLVFSNEENRFAIIKIESLGYFDTGTTGEDIVITKADGTIIDKKTIYIDAASSIGEIAFPVDYSSTVDAVYKAYWGKPGFAMADTYEMGSLCKGWYNMSNDPSLGLLDQASGLYTVPDTGAWDSADLVAGGLHRCIQSEANGNYFTYVDATAGYDVTKAHTLRVRFSCADVTRYQYPITSNYIGGFLFKINASALVITTQALANELYNAAITNNTEYEFVIKQNFDTKNNQCYLNGELVGEFDNDTMESVVGYHYIFGDSTGYNLIGTMSHVSMYQEDLDGGLLKTWYNNYANYATFFTFGSPQKVGSKKTLGTWLRGAFRGLSFR